MELLLFSSDFEHFNKVDAFLKRTVHTADGTQVFVISEGDTIEEQVREIMEEVEVKQQSKEEAKQARQKAKQRVERDSEPVKQNDVELNLKSGEEAKLVNQKDIERPKWADKLFDKIGEIEREDHMGTLEDATSETAVSGDAF